MEDYLRLYLPQIVGVIIAVVFIVVAAAVAHRYFPDEQQTIRTVRIVLVLLILFGFGIYLFTSGSVNVTPRKVIDRSDVMQHQKDFEERNTKEKEGSR